MDSSPWNDENGSYVGFGQESKPVIDEPELDKPQKLSGPVRRDRAAARQNRRKRAQLLDAIADRADKLDNALEAEATRRDNAIEKATVRANEKYQASIEQIKAQRASLWEEVLGIEGADNKEIADYMATSIAYVKQQRDKLNNGQGLTTDQG